MVSQGLLTVELFNETRLEPRRHARRRQRRDQEGDEEDDTVHHISDDEGIPEVDSESDVELLQAQELHAESDIDSQNSDAISLAASSDSAAHGAVEDNVAEQDVDPGSWVGQKQGCSMLFKCLLLSRQNYVASVVPSCIGGFCVSCVCYNKGDW